MPTRAELLGALEQAGVDLPPDFDDRTPLISSGLLDSTALFELALWVEDHVAPGLDLAAFDVNEEWDTVEGLLEFIEHHAVQH
jgi:acyl carrier protein